MKRKVLYVALAGMIMLSACSQTVSVPDEGAENQAETIPTYEETSRDDSMDTMYTVNFSDYTISFTHPAKDLELYAEVIDDSVLELINMDQSITIVRSSIENQPHTFEEYSNQETSVNENIISITGNNVTFGDFTGYYYDIVQDLGTLGKPRVVGYNLFGHDMQFVIYTNSYRQDFEPQPVGNIDIRVK